MIPAASRLNHKKLGLLHIAKKQLRLSDDDWRGILLRFAGVESSADLSEAGFELLMIELNRLGFRSSTAKRNFGHRPGFASPSQLGLIRALWKDYNGDDPNETALNAWLTRFHHVSALRFLSDEKAGPVLFALKSMVGRPRRDRSAV